MIDAELLEGALSRALERAREHDCPPVLAQALGYAVFPGGGRVRPRLCLTVAEANGNPNPAVATTAAVALELIHCASLVHDDLPQFDEYPPGMAD